MANICQITGKKMMVGHNVSHSNKKSKRVFKPNLQVKKFYLAGEDKWITLKVSAAGLRTINKLGVEACVKQARENGYLK